MKYYVIEEEYVDGRDDPTVIYVTTQPARGNSSGEPVIAGWAGTSNDLGVWAHGEYDDLDAAVQAALALAQERGKGERYRVIDGADDLAHESAMMLPGDAYYDGQRLHYLVRPGYLYGIHVDDDSVAVRNIAAQSAEEALAEVDDDIDGPGRSILAIRIGDDGELDESDMAEATVSGA